MKTLIEITKMISLQHEVATRLMGIYKNINIEQYDSYLKGLLNIETANEAREKLENVLKPDEDNMKMLTCMLYALRFTYDNYQEKGISDEVFSATNKCFTRFLNEHWIGYHKWVFDRSWWTYRQICMTIFRLGELEFEMKNIDGDKYISIHIPSDANISLDKVKDSIAIAKKFFHKYYLEYANVEYRCNSWLLSPVLKKLLPSTSKIIAFQSLFEIVKETYSSSGYISWVYKRHYDDFNDLPEKTTLQKNMKKYLLEGNLISIALGILKD